MTSATVTRIVREHLVPTLVERGFRRSGTTFRRPVAEVVQVVQVQRSTRNGPAASRFYLNGSVYVPVLDELLGVPARPEPDEPSCHVRLRPHDVLAAAPAHYDVTTGADAETVGPAAARDLVALVLALDGLTTAGAAVGELAGHGLAQYERVFGWYVSHGREEAARDFVGDLHARFGAERRWAIFADHLDAVAATVGSGADWRTWV